MTSSSAAPAWPAQKQTVGREKVASICVAEPVRARDAIVVHFGPLIYTEGGKGRKMYSGAPDMKKMSCSNIIVAEFDEPRGCIPGDI